MRSATEMSDDLLDMSPEDQPEPDVLYDDAVYLVATEWRCSTAWLQRQLKVGYNRVARIVERMEDERVVTEPDARGRREVLVSEPKEKKPRRASDKAIGSPGCTGAAPTGLDYLPRASSQDGAPHGNEAFGRVGADQSPPG